MRCSKVFLVQLIESVHLGLKLISGCLVIAPAAITPAADRKGSKRLNHLMVGADDFAIRSEANTELTLSVTQCLEDVFTLLILSAASGNRTVRPDATAHTNDACWCER